MDTASVQERLKALPTSPGVYLFRDASGKVLYVGKAASLRNRVRSYFGSPWSLTDKISRMVGQVADFESMVTDSVQEALILENTLIKRHQPRYNVRLKDDKTYPYIKVNLQEDFPRVDVTRRLQDDGARYFGPFASASSLRKTMDLLKRLFPYRSCTKAITGTDPRPCLEYYIHRCVAPCTGAATKDQYRAVVQQVVQFLEGKHEAVVRQLQRQMEEAADGLGFERAAILRDQIAAIERVTQQQKMVEVEGGDRDVIGLAPGGDQTWVEVFFIRQGKLIGREHFLLEGAQDEAPPQLLASFLKQYYASAATVPPEVLTPYAPVDAELIEGWLTQRAGKRVRLVAPQRGEKRRLVEMVEANAAQGLEQMRVRVTAERDALQRALEELREQLNLPQLPARIECYDISNIQGTNAVGSMVVFQDGKPRKAHYRKFKIKAVAGVDDYAMMREMLRRRFGRFARTHGDEGKEPDVEPWAAKPDLALIDGGRGHLNAALEVFLELGVQDVPLASIAKEEEEVFTPDMVEPVRLPRSSPALFLLQRARDEAHRFAITYHRQLRSRSAVQSVLDSLPGIGPKRKRALLRRFGSLKGVREATVEELASVPGMTSALAEKVKASL